MQLERFGLFAGLSADVLSRVESALNVETFQPGESVFREGDPGDKLYLIDAGAVRISQRLGGTGEEALAVLRAGDYFGDMALIDAHPRSADAIVDEALRCFTITRADFLVLLRDDAELTVTVLFRFIETLVERLRTNNGKIRALNLMAMW